MPLLANILKPLATLAVAFGSETVVVSYRPQYITPEFEERIKALNEENRLTEAFLSLFTSVIEGWDLKHNESDPEPIPVTAEALRSIPYDVLGEILNRVQEAVAPNPPTEPTSDAI